MSDGTAILACRERLGIKQSELAARIGVSSSYMSRIETGIEKPGMATATVHKLAAVLGTSLEAITMPFESEPEAVMSKYRKKPLVIEARQFKDAPLGNGVGLAEWCGGRFVPAPAATDRAFVVVNTLKGESVAFPGDWIIQGALGEFYPIKPEVFALTYEAAGS